MLSQEEAAKVFTTTLAAVGVRVNFRNIIGILEQTDGLNPKEIKALLQAEFITAATCLCEFGFNIPAKEYVNLKRRKLEDVLAEFRLDQYHDKKGDIFRKEFRARVDTWIFDEGDPNWLINKMIGSTGRISVEVQSNVGLITLHEPPYFDVTMDVENLARLVAVGLRHFIGSLVDKGRYEPLSKLLDKLDPSTSL